MKIPSTSGQKVLPVFVFLTDDGFLAMSMAGWRIGDTKISAEPFFPTTGDELPTLFGESSFLKLIFPTLLVFLSANFFDKVAGAKGMNTFLPTVFGVDVTGPCLGFKSKDEILGSGGWIFEMVNFGKSLSFWILIVSGRFERTSGSFESVGPLLGCWQRVGWLWTSFDEVVLLFK